MQQPQQPPHLQQQPQAASMSLLQLLQQGNMQQVNPGTQLDTLPPK